MLLGNNANANDWRVHLWLQTKTHSSSLSPWLAARTLLMSWSSAENLLLRSLLSWRKTCSLFNCTTAWRRHIVRVTIPIRSVRMQPAKFELPYLCLCRVISITVTVRSSLQEFLQPLLQQLNLPIADHMPVDPRWPVSVGHSGTLKFYIGLVVQNTYWQIDGEHLDRRRRAE